MTKLGKANDSLRECQINYKLLRVTGTKKTKGS